MMTYEQVARVAEDLKARRPEKRPSVRDVHAVTGGDYTAVQKHMKTWRLTQVSAGSETAQTLSSAILRALSTEITEQRNAATMVQSAELQDCREELEDLQREVAVQGGRMADLQVELQAALSERERVTAERDHHAERIAKLQDQLAAERAAAESARIDLVQTRLKATSDADQVAALRVDLEVRRAEVESERAARIESERRLAAETAGHQADVRRMEDFAERLELMKAERDSLVDRLAAECSKRAEAERGRDIAEQRTIAATARADDLGVREAELRARMDQLLVPPSDVPSAKVRGAPKRI